MMVIKSFEFLLFLMQLFLLSTKVLIFQKKNFFFSYLTLIHLTTLYELRNCVVVVATLPPFVAAPF